MPLFLLYLSNIGDIMARSFKWIYANCCLCRWCPGVAKRRAERRIRRAQQLNIDYESEAESGESGQVINIKNISIFRRTKLYCASKILNIWPIILIKLWFIVVYSEKMFWLTHFSQQNNKISWLIFLSVPNENNHRKLVVFNKLHLGTNIFNSRKPITKTYYYFLYKESKETP